MVLEELWADVSDSDWLDELRRTKELVAQALQNPEMNINGSTCFAALQAAPWRHELYTLAGKMSGALISIVGRKVSETKREHSMSGMTIVNRDMTSSAPDRNAQVMSKASSATTAPPAAWRRLGS